MEGSPDHLGGAVHGQPRPLHRQHRLPRPGRRLRRRLDLEPLLGPQRLRNRLRGAAGTRRADRRSGRPQAGLHRWATALLAGLRTLRGLPLDPLPCRRPRAAGGRRSDDAADHAGPDPAGLSGPAASVGDRDLVGGRRRCRRARPPARRAARAGELALDLPRQRPDRDRHRDRRPACTRRGARTRRRSSRPARRRRPGARHRPADPRHRQGAGLGLDRPAGACLLRRRRGADRRLRLPLRPPPRAGDRAAAVAGALVRARQPRRRGLLRRLRGDAALRRPAADRGLGLLRPPRRHRPLPRPADGSALLDPVRPSRRPHRPAAPSPPRAASPSLPPTPTSSPASVPTPNT